MVVHGRWAGQIDFVVILEFGVIVCLKIGVPVLAASLYLPHVGLAEERYLQVIDSFKQSFVRAEARGRLLFFRSGT